jgi:hypothetical protein
MITLSVFYRSEKYIFGRFDSFCLRLKNLLEMFSMVNKFTDLFRYIHIKEYLVLILNTGPKAIRGSADPSGMNRFFLSQERKLEIRL